MPKTTFDQLTLMYREGEQADTALWSEQRTNCLMVHGEHYNRRSSMFWTRLRDNKQISETQRLRLVRNHCHRIAHKYCEGISHFAPNVTITAANPNEIQDQKTAELNLSVLRYIQKQMPFNKRRGEAIKDFCEIGEVAWYIFWDDNAGTLIRMEESQDPETGEPVQIPVMSGGIVIKRVFGFNLVRKAGTDSMDKSPFLCVRELVPLSDLKAMVTGAYGQDKGKLEEKMKLVTEATKGSYTVLEGQQGNYRATKGQALLRQFFFRPCSDYPNGHYYFCTDNGILFEGELPGGIFPVVYAGFDEVPTSPRHRSILKQVRPLQIELNRVVSKVAEHQITLGDDKIFLTNGAKYTPGATLPGIRVGYHTGAPPTILPGRAGEQFLGYMENTAAEMYTVANLPDEMDDEPPQTNDPMIAIFLSLRKKKKYSGYGEKIIDFFVEAFTVALKTTKHHISDDTLVPMIGRPERVNIPEFKNSEDMSHRITIEESSDDPESQAAKQLVLNHFVQYAGSKMDKNDIGRLMRLSPYLNKEKIFEDYTQDYDGAENEILAMDRGETWPIDTYDDHDYLLKRLINRKKKPDFKFLPPQVQNNYLMKIQAHETVKAQLAKQLQMAAAGLVPVSGFQVKCDFYTSDPQNPLKTHRVELPSDAIAWLVQKLNAQGTQIRPLMDLPLGAQAEIAGQVSQQPPATPPGVPVTSVGSVQGSGPVSPGAQPHA